jgi:hypothetical protein
MTHLDRGHYSKKHSGEKSVDPALAKAVEERALDERITCAAAWKIASDFRAPAGEVGFTIDMLEIRIIRCQMGIFGYEPEKKAVKPMDDVPAGLENAIRDKLVDGKLTCAQAWEIASILEIPKMHVSSACETLGVKIKNCQLGAF